MIPGVNYLIYGFFSARTTPGVSVYQRLTLEENIVPVITQKWVIDNNLKSQIKNRTLCTKLCDSFPTMQFNIED